MFQNELVQSFQSYVRSIRLSTRVVQIKWRQAIWKVFLRRGDKETRYSLQTFDRCCYWYNFPVGQARANRGNENTTGLVSGSRVFKLTIR